MRLRLVATFVLFACLALPCAGCARDRCPFATIATAAAPIVPEGLGVNIHFTDPQPGELKLLAEAGFRWVRMDLKWDLTELAKGQYDFAAYDRLMSALDQYRLRAMFILDYTNPNYDSGKPPHTDEARRAFARWSVAAAKHFGGHGVIWETYNEPNIAQFWPSRPNVDDYIALALAVARAFRAEAPAEKLIGPATSGVDFAFLEACFKAGLLEYWSAVSVHPYRRSDPETAAQDYCQLRKLISKYAPIRAANSAATVAQKEIPIISSEWGYSSAWRGGDDERQSQLLARSWITNAANEIAVSIWYDWRDDGLDAKEPEHHFGTVYNQQREGSETVFEPKPAYLAVKTFAEFFRGYRFERRQDVGNDDDYVIVFRKGSETRVAAWTTSSQAHTVLIPLDVGRYSTVAHTGQNVANVMADQKGVALMLTTAPVYLSRSGH